MSLKLSNTIRSITRRIPQIKMITYIDVYVMGKKLVRAKKLYYLILDDESKYCLLKLDVASKDYVELDHDLDLFALSRLLFQQDNDSYHKIPNKKE